jgi:flagellar biosynthesis/type III secretory pathway chaperone
MHWQLIAECLRQELADYGALLGLYEQQQQSLFARDPDAVLQIGLQIEGQVKTLQDGRSRREQAVSDFALAHGEVPGATLRTLLPFVEADARPLLAALINEVNHLLHRVRRTSHQNHTLLTRTLELQQELLRELRPGLFTKTYSPTGRVSLATSRSAPTLLATG